MSADDVKAPRRAGDATVRKPALAICNECGRGPRKIRRVRFGHRYCDACYARVFVHGTCARCEQRARLPKDVPGALCLRCERAGPCHRCRRDIDEIGLQTPYGPVCPSCVRYYAPARTCEHCEKTSVHVAPCRRDDRSVLLCSGCAYPERRTCAACRKHRDVRRAGDGRLLCRPCDEIGKIGCPECGRPMPAGAGKRCWDCDWRARLAKRIEMNRAAFAQPAMADHFEAFGHWLGETVGVEKAAITINRYLAFFMEIERRWGSIPDYGALVGHFGTAGLRKVLLPTRWLEAAGLVVVDAAVKREAAYRGSIELAVERLVAPPASRTILAAYRDALMARHASGDLALASVKSFVVAAAGLLSGAAARNLAIPDQPALDDYIAERPGQRASLTGVVRYLSEVHGGELRLPPVDAPGIRRRRREALGRRAEHLLDERANGIDIGLAWRILALELFHDLSPAAARRVAASAAASDVAGGTELVDGDRVYYVPQLSESPRRDGGSVSVPTMGEADVAERPSAYQPRAHP